MTVIRMGRGKAMAAILEVAMPSLGALGDFEREEEHRQFVAQWLNGDTMATKRIEAALAATGFSFDDVAAQSPTVQATQLSRIDQTSSATRRVVTACCGRSSVGERVGQRVSSVRARTSSPGKGRKGKSEAEVLERYERRSTSRRQAALRDFDLACRASREGSSASP